MATFKELQPLVKTVLENNPKARDCDELLYHGVIMLANPDAVTTLFGSILLHFDEYGIPSFESVSRIRRKLQRDFPELKGSRTVESWRSDNEGIYNAYAHGNMEVTPR